jgi:hypothetical protein
VDPDAWLASLDQKRYLRHVGRDGCVDVDLTTYYIGPQLAGRTVLLQVWAQQHQFAVWSQDQIVKLLPIKGLVGQQMALDDYLQYIKQEALAAPRRSSVRGSRKSGSRLYGERGLDSSFLAPTFSHACLTFGQVRASSCFSARSRRRITRSTCLSDQLFSLIASSSFSYTSAFLS